MSLFTRKSAKDEIISLINRANNLFYNNVRVKDQATAEALRNFMELAQRLVNIAEAYVDDTTKK